MGSIYVAYDRVNQSRVAIKALSTMSAELLRLFKNEFRAVQDLAHPNLARLGELFEHEDQYFFTMELIDGVDFLTYVRNGSAVEGSLEPTSGAQTSDIDGAVLLKSHRISTAPSSAIPSLPAMPIPYDEARLRSCLAGLLRGLDALHRAHVLHRDIKPSNVMATAQGRVVVLDFGIASRVEDEEYVPRVDPKPMGTPAYMSPEQTTGDRLTAATDLYSVGVMLYQVLAGRLPFVGTPGEVIRRKCMEEAPGLDSMATYAPADLCKLCRDLLRVHPAERPSAAAILAQLENKQKVARNEVKKGESFVGRKRELMELQTAFADVRRGASVIMLVQGESGIGKSALTKHFVRTVVRQNPDIMILRSRCYEREAACYKAMDGIIDGISLRLQQLNGADAAALLPDSFPLLVRLFASLDPLLDCKEFSKTHIADPAEQRKQGIAALRELLRRVVQRQPLILLVEDLQWADDDSFQLISELLRPPEAPALLLLATMRTSSTGRVLSEGGGISLLKNVVRHLALEKLPKDDAYLLVEALLGQQSDPTLRQWIKDVVAEAQGHPLYVDELVRLRGRIEQGQVLRLDEALWLRIQQMAPAGRYLIEALAVAGVPLEQGALLQAASLDSETFDAQVAILRAEHLVRTAGGKRTDFIEPYHDRVRESVYSHLSNEQHTQWHGRLAVVLERNVNADLEQLMMHWEGSGQPKRAGEYALRAAEKAERSMAFEHAARLYRRSIELLQPSREQLRHLKVRLAEALIHARRGYEGAQELMLAAADAPSEQASQLRAQAGEQFVSMGYYNQGVELLNQSLSDLGILIFRYRSLAVLSLALQRLYLRFKGLDAVVVPEDEISPNDIRRLDAINRYSFAISHVDWLTSGESTVRALRISLKVGSAKHMAIGLLSEAAAVGTMQGRTSWDYCWGLLCRARELLGDCRDMRLMALLLELEGNIHYCHGRFAKGLELCIEAEKILISQCSGVSFLLNSTRLIAFINNFYLGQISVFIQRGYDLLIDAESRNDLHGQCLLRTVVLPVMNLAFDDAISAQRDLDWSYKHWQAKDQGVPMVYFYQWAPQVLIYQGQGAAAYEFLTKRLPMIFRGFINSTRTLSLIFKDLQGRCAIAAAQGQVGYRRKRLFRKVWEIAQKISGADEHWANPLAQVLRAAVFAEHNDRPAAIAELKAAADAFAAVDMKMHAAVAHIRLAQMYGSDNRDHQETERGTDGARNAAAWLRSEGIVNVERWVNMLAPGFVDSARSSQ